MATRGSTTDPIRPPTPDLSAPRRPWRWIGLGALAAVAVGAFAVWYLVLRTDAPDEVDLGAAVQGITPPAGDQAASTPSGNTSDNSGVDGTWTVDRSVANAEGTGSFGGFRVNEQLVGVGAATAVGRSRTVEGTLTVDGTTVTAASVTVDLTAITTNDSRRNDAVQRALATSQFPRATFTLTQPVSVGSVPAEGQRIDVKATGDLTIKGVTKRVTVDLSAQLEGDVLVAVGSTPVTFADFGVRAPTAPIVASVEDHGVMEFQLYFTKR
ncbi:MAG: YceI family protein [Acidimicrobiia bacterium]